MNFKMFRGYTTAGLGAIVLLAGVVLVLGNIGKHCDLSVFGKPVSFSVGLLMLLSLVGGVVLVWTARLFGYGLRTLRAGKLDQEFKLAVHAAHRPPPPAEKPAPPVEKPAAPAQPATSQAAATAAAAPAAPKSEMK